MSNMAFVNAQDIASDAEQQYLSSCYYYSGMLGYNIDSIHNPDLYKSIISWLGVKYCYSGDSKDGIDCSGFASAVYQVTLLMKHWKDQRQTYIRR